MSIELELHLEGPDANEKTLLDLLDWLGREDISDLRIGRKELPPVEGKAGGDFDPYTIVTTIVTISTVIQAISIVVQLIRSFLNWRKTIKRDVDLNVQNVNVNDEKLKNDKKIAALTEEIRQKFEKNRHKK